MIADHSSDRLTTLHPAILEPCQEDIGTFPGGQLKTTAMRTNHELATGIDNCTKDKPDAAASSVNHERCCGSAAPTNGTTQDSSPLDHGSEGTGTMVSSTIFPGLDRVTNSSKESIQQSIKPVDKRNILDGAKACDNIGMATNLEDLHPSLANTSSTVMLNPNAELTGEASEESSTPHKLKNHAKVTCMTEVCSHPSKFVIGCGKIIPRWVPESIVRYYVNTSSFLTQEDADHTTSAVVGAATLWNNVGGRVPTFERVSTVSEAVFTIDYADKPGSENDEGTFALGFFPNGNPVVYVYALAFEDEYREFQKNVLCHELGHVLGARHSFAPEKEQLASTILGECNPQSVMNYFDHPRQLAIQESDARGMRMLYELGTSYKQFNIIDHPPQLITPSSSPAQVEMTLPLSPPAPLQQQPSAAAPPIAPPAAAPMMPLLTDADDANRVDEKITPWRSFLARVFTCDFLD